MAPQKKDRLAHRPCETLESEDQRENVCLCVCLRGWDEDLPLEVPQQEPSVHDLSGVLTGQRVQKVPGTLLTAHLQKFSALN